MGTFSKRAVARLALLGLIIPALAACSVAPAAPIRETVVVTAVPQVVKETVIVPQTPVAPVQDDFSTPHPILSNVKVRQAIVYCTNRPELIKSVYPFLDGQQQQALLMNTFLPQGHWALNTNVVTYPFDPEKGKALLAAAGWTLPEGETVRVNANGDPLSISFTTTNAQFRQTWSAVFIQELADCGIQIIPTYAPASWWFGSSTGIKRRDFELGAYGWIGQADPAGVSLYSCKQIPTPANSWEGQNFMGWCNERASQAIVAANNTLDRHERIKQYGIAQEEFAKDMVSLPVFNRAEAAAASNHVQGLKPDPTEYYTANALEWKLNGGDTLVLGFTQEPATLWGLIESASTERAIQHLFNLYPVTQYSYDFQPLGQTQLSTIENNLAKNTDVQVQAGDKVWNTDGEAVELAAGVKLNNAAGETITYESGPVTMKQLTATYNFAAGQKWEDGQPLTAADYKLARKINCDPDSGAVSFSMCDSIQTYDVTSDTSITVTYLPGVQWSTYFYTPWSLDAPIVYPAHRVLSDGRKLADVPAKEWSILPEVTEHPLSNGPYILESWEKGQRMTFKANPNYFRGEPAIKKIVIKFISDTNQAVAQLLTGDVDVLGNETLGAGSEVETVLEAAKKGQVQVFMLASSTWEHIDMNLYVR